MAKQKLIDQNINQENLSKKTYRIFELAKAERPFLIITLILVSIAGIITEYTYAAMWFVYWIDLGDNDYLQLVCLRGGCFLPITQYPRIRKST